MSLGIITDQNEFITNLTLSLYYYLKNNIQATIEGKALTIAYDIPQTLEDVKDKLPLVVLAFGKINAGTDYALGYGQNIRATYSIWIYGGGFTDNRINERSRQEILSRIYSLFNRKVGISFKEYPTQVEKGLIDAEISMSNIVPATTNVADLFRARADIIVDLMLQ
jgi:hypothetical protein